ncbi:MAG: hypothetical protein B5766_07715 [Candidatus Lumbricidophila eiseniae]|uniref:Uncharacterized protein n=1 Tax=Candidatus Lumbricidiphila eiseniae TaxID=1969409 RepID=A0A2A6FQN4_9MICO|nr:MAG: hypothetical protein B5766_07715 [Candidatus Lumbricidophila eiseniae]
MYFAPSPNFNNPINGLLDTIWGWLAGIVIVLGTIVIIAGAIMLILGGVAGHNSNLKTLGWKCIFGAIIAVFIATAAAVWIGIASAQGEKVHASTSSPYSLSTSI